MPKKLTDPNNEILIYQTDDGRTKVEVAFDGETVWLTQAKMAELFQTTPQNITMHLKKIYAQGELSIEATCKQSLQVQIEGERAVKRENIKFYNLDAIISVGYRVDSHRGIQFRKWASDILKEYMRKGFAMNDDLLKQAGSGSYFKELLDRIRDIRSSEKVFYRQVLDLFATSIDYDAKSEIAVDFFKVMQNKLLFANAGGTAAELIAGRANAELPFMGLQAFKGERPVKSEAVVAKNYLTETEVKNLNLMVSAYLDIAEAKVLEHKIMYMRDWVKELERFIVYRERPVLSDGGRVTHDEAMKIAVSEYDKYKAKAADELTQVERDFLDTIHRTYELLEKKPTHKGKPKT
jgi:hypothetical protein